MTFIHAPVRDSLYRLSYSIPDRDLELEGLVRAGPQPIHGPITTRVTLLNLRRLVLQGVSA